MAFFHNDWCYLDLMGRRQPDFPLFAKAVKHTAPRQIYIYIVFYLQVFHDVAHFTHGYRFAYVAFSRILIQSGKVRLRFSRFSRFPPGEMIGYPCRGF